VTKLEDFDLDRVYQYLRLMTLEESFSQFL